MVIENVVESSAENRTGRVAKNASIYLLSQIITWIVTFASVSIIPRYLGPDLIGQMVIVGTMALLVMNSLMLGIDSYLAKEIGRDRSQTERMLRATLGLRLALSLPACLIAWVWLWLLHPSALVWTLGLLAIATIPLGFLAAPLRAVFAGREQAQRVSLLDIAAAASSLLAIPFLSVAHPARGAIAIAIVGILMLLGNIIFPCIWLRRSMRVSPVIAPKLWGELIKGGLPFLVNGFILTLYATVTVFQLKHYTNPASVGVYSQAQRLFGTFLFVPTALGAALLPSLARLAQASESEFRRMQSRVLSLLIILGLPVMAGVMLLARPLSLLLYGPAKFVTMPQVLQVYALVIIPMYIVSTMYQFLVAQNRNALWSGFLLTTVGIYALSSMFLIPYCRDHFHEGAIGAVCATLIAETCSTIFAFVLLKNNPLQSETLFRIVRALVATAGMAGVILGTQRLFAFLPQHLQYHFAVLLPTVLVPAALGTLTFVALGWLLRILSPEEQEKIVGMVRRKLRRG